MGKNFIFRVIGVAMAMVSIISCDMVETAMNDSSPLGSTDKYPVATLTPSITGTSFTEGQTLVYTIKLDRAIDRALTYTFKQTGGTADENDYAVSIVVLQPYTTEAKMSIAFIADDYPEVEETLQFEIGVFGIAEKYMLNSKSVNPLAASIKVVNKNDAKKLTLIFSWPNTDDNDIVIWSDTPTDPHTEWGDMGASTKNPEVDKSIDITDPDGNYYVNIMDWDNPPFTYTFIIGLPDGTMQTITGSFNRTTTTYINDFWTSWGGKYDSFRVLKIVKSGSKFTITKL